MKIGEVYDFGLRLKALREDKGLSQAEVARRIEVDKIPSAVTNGI